MPAPPGVGCAYELWRDRDSAACIKRLWKQRKKANRQAKGRGDGTIRSMHCNGRILPAGKGAMAKQAAAVAKPVADMVVEQTPARKQKRQSAPVPTVVAAAALQPPVQLAASGMERAAQGDAPTGEEGDPAHPSTSCASMHG